MARMLGCWQRYGGTLVLGAVPLCLAPTGPIIVPSFLAKRPTCICLIRTWDGDPLFQLLARHATKLHPTVLSVVEALPNHVVSFPDMLQHKQGGASRREPDRQREVVGIRANSSLEEPKPFGSSGRTPVINQLYFESKAVAKRNSQAGHPCRTTPIMTKWARAAPACSTPIADSSLV